MRTLLFTLLAFIAFDISGQKVFDGMSVGASAGPTVFYGDLSEFDIIPVKPSNADTYGFAWSAFISRDMYKGLGIKLTYENGFLTGGRLPGKESVEVHFETRYQSGMFQVNYNILDALSKKDALETRTYLEMQVGVGMTMYRSASYWSDSGSAREYVGYTEPESSISETRKELLEEADPLQAINFPVGINFGYRINHKTDVFFNATLNNTMTDELDTWLRGWSANDKYLYAGLGIRLNFNRSDSDYPEKKTRTKRDKKKNANGDSNGSDGSDGSNGNSIFGKYKNQNAAAANSNQNGDGTDMLNLQLQMFELQMKLFEMFYLEKK